MRSLGPRVLVGAASLGLIALLVLRDAQTPGPGELHPVHARVADLQGLAGCILCHGQERSSAAMRDACVACHDSIGAQLRSRSGLHGRLGESPGGTATQCSHCHGEHHAGSTALVSDVSFDRAGFAGTAGYDHAGLDFGLLGRHATLDCDACHEHAFTEVLPIGASRFLGLAQTCTSCHSDPHAGAMPRSCADCHGQSDAFSSVALFKHPAAFPLEAPHDGLACSNCHAPGELDERIAPDHAASDAANEVRACADCHQPNHSARFLARVEASCADCHGLGSTTFADAHLETTALHHAATGFALDGAHVGVACSSCHGGGSFEDRFPAGRVNDCSACHDDVHRGAFRSAEPSLSAGATPAGTDCARCHGTASFRPVLGGEFDHGLWTGFELVGAHGTASCVSCHGPARDAARTLGFVSDAYAGSTQECSTCHASPHGSRFTERVRDSNGAFRCSDCHTQTSFLDILPTSFDHGAATGFALTARHAEARCTTCHVPPVDGSTRLGDVRAAFDGDATRCATCHASPHDDRFVELATGDGQQADCARCHSPTGFLDIAPGTFDHAASTGFALEGAHAQARCTSCHVPPEDLSRRLGSVTDAHPGDPGLCATCHSDPHGGLFDAPGRPRVASGRVGCARCHGTTSFHDLVHHGRSSAGTGSFDHGPWTDWPLDGAHAEANCAACHPPLPPGDVGRRSGPAAGRSCADCHADPHLGQFQRTIDTEGCAACHASTASFANIAFDHGGARFTLDAQHAELDCSACHRPTRTTDGRVATRYRPIAHECADCHDPGNRRDRRDDGDAKTRGAGR